MNGKVVADRTIGSVFLRHRNLIHPFVKALDIEGFGSIKNPIDSLPVMICTDRFFSMLCVRGKRITETKGYPRFLSLVNQEKNYFAHCSGKLGKVFLYKIPLKNNLNLFGSSAVLLCNLTTKSKNNKTVAVKISRMTDPFTFFQGQPAQYMFCEEIDVHDEKSHTDRINFIASPNRRL